MPGGKLLLFEHIVDVENFVIFGPGIDHWCAAATGCGCSKPASPA